MKTSLIAIIMMCNSLAHPFHYSTPTHCALQILQTNLEHCLRSTGLTDQRREGHEAMWLAKEGRARAISPTKQEPAKPPQHQVGPSQTHAVTPRASHETDPADPATRCPAST
ncbi:hypothetical protein IWZ00DRAFT_512779 [Phyllosticta capitalensis]